MAHALVHSVLGFAVARFCLGLGESGNFPSAIKTIAEWFPKKERALATGIFNSGTNVGATIAPLVVPWIAIHLGWRFAFLFTGFFSTLWVICWLAMYRTPQEHPRLSRTELSYIEAGLPDSPGRIPWLHLIPHRQTWAFVIGKFLTDPIWWFLLFWLPKYLVSNHDLRFTGLGWPLVVIYNAATVGSIFGGWIAARFLRAGWTLNRARKTAMLICAIAMVPIISVAYIRSLWGAVALLSLGTAAHQGWSANNLTLASDMFPRQAVASVVGIGGFGGALGGVLIATFTGLVLQITGSYAAIFVIAGCVYLVALLAIQLLAPTLEPANIEYDAAR